MGPLFTDQRAVAQYTGKRPFGRLPFFPLSFRRTIHNAGFIGREHPVAAPDSIS
jgi:hypothetical protein